MPNAVLFAQYYGGSKGTVHFLWKENKCDPESNSLKNSRVMWDI